MSLRKASFGIGCFWSETVFGKLEGVKVTRVGYSGGTKDEPTYHDLGDHTETVQVEYDPEQISYEGLLEVFWDSHDPTRKNKAQYRSVVFYHTQEQKEKAESSKKKKEEELGNLETSVEPLKKFYLAEDYHQKYRLRHSEVMEKFEDLSSEEFRESEEATKANARVAESR